MPNPEKEKIRLVIVDDISNTRDNIIHLLEFEEDIEVIASVGTGQEAIDICAKSDPDVVLMDINMPDLDGIKATELIRSTDTSAQVIMLTVQGEISYMRKAMIAGARDYLTKPPEPDELISTIRRSAAFAREERKRKQAERAALLAASGASQEIPKNGQLVMVYAPKGGSGVTTLSVNIACALQNLEGRTLLLDANTQYGDIPMFINQNSRYCLLDFTSRADQLDSEVIADLVMQHKSSEMDVILGTPKFEQAEQIQAEALGVVLDALLLEYKYIVADMPRQIDDLFLTILDRVSVIVVPIMQDLPAIRNAQVFLDLMSTLNISREKILMVMNKADRRISITADRISKNLKLPIEFEVVLDEKTVLNSINRGIPYTLDLEETEIKKQTLDIARKVVGMVTPVTNTDLRKS